MDKRQIKRWILDGLTDEEIQVKIDEEKQTKYDDYAVRFGKLKEINADDFDDPSAAPGPASDTIQNTVDRIVKTIDTEATPSAAEQKSLDDLETLVNGGL